jgi:uncharacterized protein
MDSRIQELLSAVERGDLHAVQVLLSSGLDVNARNAVGWSAITVAAFHQHLTLVQYLLGQGADPNSKNNKGTTALMYAKTKAARFELLDVLLDAGADVNATDMHGKTVLDYAEATGRTSLVEFLKSKGALTGVSARRA